MTVVASVVLVMTCTQILNAQSGMTWSDFSLKLHMYFADELVEDVRKQLPKAAEFRIWGWDIGDFTGDTIIDLAFVVRLSTEKKKNVVTYLFIDDEGFLLNVARLPNQFLDLPLEVGVSIRDTTCFVTKKNKEYDWVLRGYQFRNGALLLRDEFATRRVGIYAYQSKRNFLNLQSEDKYSSALDYKSPVSKLVDFYSVPCYPRGKQFFNGYDGSAEVSTTDYVLSGTFFWSGPKDGSFTLKTAYDDRHLYISADVRDDEAVFGWCDSCIRDQFEFWFDTKKPEHDNTRQYEFTQKKMKRLVFRDEPDAGMYGIVVKLGDLSEKKPVISLSTTDTLEPEQKLAVASIRAIAHPTLDGYELKLRIPCEVFGFSRCPVAEDIVTELGFTTVFRDCDNQFRPEETTVLASSTFDPLKPSTFGSLLFMPVEREYGEYINIYADALLKFLNEMGF